MTMRIGSEARVLIYSLPYKVNAVRVRDLFGDADLTNSEGAPYDGFTIAIPAGEGSRAEFSVKPYGSLAPTVGDVEITITASTYDDTENRFDSFGGAGGNGVIRAGIIIPFEFQPDSRPAPHSWRLPNALILETDHDMKIREGQPFTIRVKNNGKYYCPGQT